jgi:hypothetical protein
MNEILKFLIKHCSFLYEKYGFRFIDSAISESSKDASVILGAPDVNIRFCMERGQLLVEFQSNHFGRKNVYSWYSIDVLRQLVTGEKECNALMDEENTNFLKDNIITILDLFSKQKVRDTISKLKQLERIRSQALSS